MVHRLKASDSGFASAFERFLRLREDRSMEAERSARLILDDVRERGEKAVIEWSEKYDGFRPGKDRLRVEQDEIDSAFERVGDEVLGALKFAHERIRIHHERQMPRDERFRDSLGAETGWKWTPLESVGLYVPGGGANYPSSALMSAIPASVAGVPRIVMATPAHEGKISPSVLVAAKLAGVHEIYRIGGAQAIAAMAFGCESVEPVVKITGPGNAWVAAAKRQLFGKVGIDSIAGPSEVLVIADKENNPEWIAADLLAQAEHDEMAQAILIADDQAFAERVCEALEAQLKNLPRAEIAGASWKQFGAVILVEDLEDAIALANRIAAEHVQIAAENPDSLFERIQNAGAVFLGRHTPEAIGDYVAGSNHVLPTSRSARFSSGLSTLDYCKRTSVLRLDAEALNQLAPAARRLAQIEGLEAHERSIAIRTKKTI